MSPTSSRPIAPAQRVVAPSLASVRAVPAAVPAAVILDLLDQRSALPLGDHVDRPNEHVEHVHAHGDRHHLAHSCGRGAP